MAKPTDQPDWHPTDPALIVEPLAADKLAGFAPGDKPPAEWFNWFWEVMSDLWDYVISSDFSGGPSGIGLRATGAANVGLHGIGAGTGNAGVKGTGGSAGPGAEGFGGAGGSGVEGNGGTGTATGVIGRGGASFGPGVAGFATAGNGNGVEGTGVGTGAGTRGQSATGPGGRFLKGSSSGTVGLDTDGTLKFTGANPASTVGAQNELNAMLCTKAWALVTVDTTASVLAGANIASVTLPGSDVIRVTFTQKFANLLVAPFLNGVLETAKNTSVEMTNWAWHDDGTGKCDYFEFKLRSEGGAGADATIDPTSTDVTFSIQFFGAQ